MHRYEIAQLVEISGLDALSVAIKEPRDFRLEAKILAEDMGLEPTGLLRFT